VLAAAERRFQLRLAVTFPESTWCLWGRGEPGGSAAAAALLRIG